MLSNLNFDINLDPTAAAASQKPKENTSSTGISGKVKIYPNPTENFINIDLKSEANNTSLVLSNIAGRNLGSWKMNSNSKRIDLSNLAKGVYLLEVKNHEINEIRKIVIE